ncbi:hypothetical protein JMN12_00390 [Capnocytophaga genosp. AHN8471]|uniref:hypothetical protein n=1 Tax=Capnocytophaga genosp. AHN8471 TaxID=327574 RepID=UPI00193159FD|nr:hypothetical protein [Capnocytophaga genosp. AHN8471]MBM0655034.1 hypothetical protein [Capnocytophaga genosp. AHN8471]
MCYVGKPAIAGYVLQTPPQEKLLGQPLLFSSPPTVPTALTAPTTTLSFPNSLSARTTPTLSSPPNPITPLSFSNPHRSHRLPPLLSLTPPEKNSHPSQSFRVSPSPSEFLSHPSHPRPHSSHPSDTSESHRDSLVNLY